MEIATFIIQGVLVVMFVMAGMGKVTGSKMQIEGFERYRLPQWFRIVTGIVELIGAALLIVGYWLSGWAIVGALLLGLTGIGGIITHVRAKDSFKATIPIIVLCILSFFVCYMYL
ncbi:MAG: DoxX family protein [Anaerobacillus sp.]